ncbi:MAG: hypothetical protein AAF466_06440 [Bacteroidota bacterium]
MKKQTQFLTLCSIFVFGAFLVFSSCDSKEPKEVAAVYVPILDPELPAVDTLLKQVQADIYSWQSFIALNWPANMANCTADTTDGTSILSGKGPVVWETYLTSDQVFVPEGSTPDAWCTSDLSRHPEKVQALALKTGVKRILHTTAKSPHSLDQASGGPLVDQNGRFVRYEVRMNQDEYNYIMRDTLWSKKGQQSFIGQGKTVDFPSGNNSGVEGAIEIKAAWKVIGEGDDPSRFYTIQAIVYNDNELDPSPGPNPVTLGLVGLHIAHKINDQKNWVWSTFEQIDNLTKSFNNPACDTCAVNQPLPGQNQKELDSLGNPNYNPTQVTRVNAINDKAVDSLNTVYQKKLEGSLWANYKLISTQWLLFEDITPLFLANSVQETYLQGPHPPSYGNFTPIIDEQYYEDPKYKPFSPNTSASCMGCHYVATLPGSEVKADFSFLLGDAQ